MTLWSLSITEIAVSYAGLKKFEIKVFSDLLWHTKNPLNAKIPVFKKNQVWTNSQQPIYSRSRR